MALLKDIIISKINSGNADIDVDQFNNLNPSERSEVEYLICSEIYKKNSKFYRFIPYLQNIDLVRLMSSGHMSEISSENERLELMTYTYIKSPNPDVFEYIVRESKLNSFGLTMLEEILRFYPNYKDLAKYIADKKKSLLNDEKSSSLSDGNDLPENKNSYYKINGGLIVKINNDECMLYVLDLKRKEWRADPELYGEYAYGVVHLEPIKFDDIYPTGDSLDLAKGKVL